MATTAGRPLEATVRAAESVTIRRQDGAKVTWTRRDADREPWLPEPAQVTSETVTVVGRLEHVDLRSRRFRIRDDLGNYVELQDVLDADTVGPLVGQCTAA